MSQSIEALVGIAAASFAAGGVVVLLWARGRVAAVRNLLDSQLGKAQEAAREADASILALERELGESRSKAEETQRALAEAQQSSSAAATELEQLKTTLSQAEAERDQARQQAEALGEELEQNKAALEQAPQRSGESASGTLEVLKNDPALGAGQFETLRMMYEQFTAKSVLGGK